MKLTISSRLVKYTGAELHLQNKLCTEELKKSERKVKMLFFGVFIELLWFVLAFFIKPKWLFCIASNGLNQPTKFFQSVVVVIWISKKQNKKKTKQKTLDLVITVNNSFSLNLNSSSTWSWLGVKNWSINAAFVF